MTENQAHDTSPSRYDTADGANPNSVWKHIQKRTHLLNKIASNDAGGSGQILISLNKTKGALSGT